MSILSSLSSLYFATASLSIKSPTVSLNVTLTISVPLHNSSGISEFLKISKEMFNFFGFMLK